MLPAAEVEVGPSVLSEARAADDSARPISSKKNPRKRLTFVDKSEPASSESTVAADVSSQCKRPGLNKKSKEETLVNEQVQTDNTPCMYCEVVYCESKVKWFSCKNCHSWSCAKCARIGRKKVFLCDSCK